MHGLISFLRLCKISELYQSKLIEEKVFKDIEKYGVGKKKTVDDYLVISGIKELVKNENYSNYIKLLLDKI
jgi:hypothetical protein